MSGRLHGLSVAYLVNQYPKVSHSFIRREIRALERLGLRVARLSVRPSGESMVDPADLEEAARTRYVLRQGPSMWLRAILGAIGRAPLLWQAARLAIRLGRHGDRPLPYYLVYLAEACVVAAWLRDEGIEHLHAHFGTNSAWVAMFASILSGVPYSFTVHGPEEFDRPQALALREKARLAEFVVAISSYGRSQLYRWLTAADWPKVRIVRCGLDDLFRQTVPAGRAEPARLVCVGRLCEQKGQLLLVAALRQVVDTGMPVHLVLAGDGEMRGDVERLIDALKLGRHVTITGWLGGEQVRDELLRARALVLPSFAEGLPVVLMEAMALERPVLSTYVAGIPELVTPDCGTLVPAGDVDALAAAMLDLLRRDNQTLLAMGRHARQRVLDRHDVDAEASRLALSFADSVEARRRMI